MNISIRNFGLTLLFVGFGLLLPYIFGLVHLEQRLLTMQIPVLLSAYFLPMKWSVMCAILTPTAGSMLLGVPALYPMFPIMLCQFIALAASFNMLHVVMERKIMPSLLIAILVGWVLFFCAASIMSWVLEGIDATAFTWNYLKAGWPGILLQIVVVPLVLWFIQKIKQKKIDRQKN